MYEKTVDTVKVLSGELVRYEKRQGLRGNVPI